MENKTIILPSGTTYTIINYEEEKEQIQSESDSEIKS